MGDIDICLHIFELRETFYLKTRTLQEFACHLCAGGHVNLLRVIPIFVYVLWKQTPDNSRKGYLASENARAMRDGRVTSRFSKDNSLFYKRAS